MLPRSGDVLNVTSDASVQFTHAILFRVIRIHDWPTYEGWIWLDGYQLDRYGEAIERRSIFVKIAGLVAASSTPATPRADIRARNAGRVADRQRRATTFRRLPN